MKINNYQRHGSDTRESEIVRDLAEILAERDMSKAEFARKMHTSPQNITNWCKRGVPVIKALEAASVLGVNVSDISTLRHPEEPPAITPENLTSARDVMTALIELKMLKNLDQKELYRLIGMLENLPAPAPEPRSDDQ